MATNRKETISVYKLVYSELEHELSIDKNIDKPEAIKRKLNALLPWFGYKARMKEYWPSKYMEITKKIAKKKYRNWVEIYSKEKHADYNKLDNIEVKVYNGVPDEKNFIEYYVFIYKYAHTGKREMDDKLFNLDNILKGVFPETLERTKDEEYYLKRGCTETQLAYIKLFHLTKKYIKQNPKTTDGKKMSINKAVIIVYNDNKEIFPNWADSTLNSYYYKGENLTISI